LWVEKDEEIQLDVQQITIYANGGEFSQGMTVLEQFESPSHPLVRAEPVFEAPVREGHSYIGWATSADAQIQEIIPDVQYENIDPSVTELFAVWRLN